MPSLASDGQFKTEKSEGPLETKDSLDFVKLGARLAKGTLRRFKSVLSEY